MKSHYKKITLASAILAVLGLSGCEQSREFQEPEARTSLEFVEGESTIKPHFVGDELTVNQTIRKTINGVITTMPTLSINNVAIDALSANVIIDGVQVDPSLLDVGMVVSASGIENPDGSLKAEIIEFNNDIEGVVLANDVTTNSRLNIMGQSVFVNQNTVFKSFDPRDLRIADIDVGNIVEVSGHSSGDGTFWATRLEVKATDQSAGSNLEVFGNISQLTQRSFKLGGLSVNFAGAFLNFGINGSLAEGQYVEVSSLEGFNFNNELVAAKIELAGDNGFKRINHELTDHEVEQLGVVTKIVSAQYIEVNGSPVILNSTTEFRDVNISTLQVGQTIKVEALIDLNHNLIAKKVELKLGFSTSPFSSSNTGVIDDSIGGVNSGVIDDSIGGVSSGVFDDSTGGVSSGAFDDSIGGVSSGVFDDSIGGVNSGVVEQIGVVTKIVGAQYIEVNGSPVSLNSSTEFRDISIATLQVGQTIKVKALIDINGNLIAKRIELK